MRRFHFAFRAAPLTLVFLISAFSAFAQTAQLGRVSFPNSGAPQAQEQFLRGIAALHSFWYEEAFEAFQAARRVNSPEWNTD